MPYLIHEHPGQLSAGVRCGHYHPRPSPASYQLFELLLMMPRFIIEWVRQKLETTFPTATAAIKVLEELGIVTEMTGQKRIAATSTNMAV